MSLEHQFHSKFKIFRASSIKSLSEKVTAFTQDGKVAAKSLGVEYLNQSGDYLLSLGYAEGQSGYSVKLFEAVAGPLPHDDKALELCASLEAAAENAGDVICHELYVDADKTVHLVFLAKA